MERILIDDMTVMQGTVTSDTSHSLRLVLQDAGDNYVDLIIGTSTHFDEPGDSNHGAIIESRTAWMPLSRDHATQLMLALAVALHDGM